jgi:hypothetical protein
MRMILARVIPAVTAAVLVCGVAQAGEAGKPADREATVGVGMICNTADQARHYLAFLASGEEPKLAMNAANTEASDPHACGLAAIAYIRGETVATKSVHDKLLEVVRVDVVAGFNGSGWQRVVGLIQYAVVVAPGIGI